MSERPDALALLEAARTAVIADLLPLLEGDDRTTALMIAKALSIATRELTGEPVELRLADGSTPADEAVREQLRAGVLADEDGSLRAALLDLTRARLQVSNPKMLTTLDSLYENDAC